MDNSSGAIFANNFLNSQLLISISNYDHICYIFVYYNIKTNNYQIYNINCDDNINDVALKLYNLYINGDYITYDNKDEFNNYLYGNLLISYSGITKNKYDVDTRGTLYIYNAYYEHGHILNLKCDDCCLIKNVDFNKEYEKYKIVDLSYY